MIWKINDNLMIFSCDYVWDDRCILTCFDVAK